MNVSTILNRFLFNVTPNMHKTRRDAVSSCAQSLLHGAHCSVTSIGRGIHSTAKEKHNIKRADRLCSNAHLHKELIAIYQAIAHQFITTNRPIIHVDWSDLDVSKRNFLIRASIALDGRSITLYQEVHSLKTKEKPATHLSFLTTLQTILNSSCKPIIVTDAGFKAPWFRQVIKLGWDFVGRTRKPNFYILDGERDWQCITQLYQKATQVPKSFNGSITRYKPLTCRLVLYKKTAKGRHHINRQGIPHASTQSKQHAKGAKDPWLLSTSLKQKPGLAKKVVAIYRTRMQIEEGFRDMKSVHLGLGYNISKSYKPMRLAILLFLNVIASIVLILVGIAVSLANKQFQYQANTIKTRRVLSYHFVGLRAIADKKLQLSLDFIQRALKYAHCLINKDYCNVPL